VFVRCGGGGYDSMAESVLVDSGEAEPEAETLDLVLDTADLETAIALAFVVRGKLHCISNTQMLRVTKGRIYEVED
jgi:hypothetical protein